MSALLKIRSPWGKGGLLAVAAAVAFGVTPPLIQKFGGGAGPFPTATLLYAGAALVSARVSSPRTVREARLGRPHLARLLAVATVGAVGAPVCLAWGLQHTSATGASLLLNFEAIFTVILGWRLYNEPIGRRMVAALAAMVLGSAVLMTTRGTTSSNTSFGWGSALVILAALAWAADNALTRPLADLDPVQVVRWKSALGATLGGVLSVGSREAFPSALNAMGLLACGAVGYGLSLQLYLLAQRRIGAGRTGSIFAVAPFVGAGVAWVMGERLATISTLGAALLFGWGVYLHITERHGHGHKHDALEHDHAHTHDDDHHDHDHAVVAAEKNGPHTHPHRHDAGWHEHPHGSDVHHQHRHS